MFYVILTLRSLANVIIKIRYNLWKIKGTKKQKSFKFIN